ncbi:MAG: class I SAM-dependent methyltransferase [Candidatus Eisenbacteria bacterium]|uniref:Class I SAM-dependent methyltransferase n=1 Tax=Eiseniibacteriota bacterium TaxID=2212470 RepID=A0A849SP65_UNCEI|nr:class I SAM-dependent methyltransferase [Candidatus Eisenbacteria bacterium]
MTPHEPGTRDEYRPREFWERRLSGHFDLRGTGETGLSEAYNRACYSLRRTVLDRALLAARFDPRDRTVLDVGCGSGFFTEYYSRRGAHVTGIDIAPISIDRMRARFPAARFVLGDVSEVRIEGRFDLINAFDVLYHVTDDRRWEVALGHLAEALNPGGLMLLTDNFPQREGQRPEAAHNKMRPLSRYLSVLVPHGLAREALHPTHGLLNRELGPFRSLNRVPALLLLFDRTLLATGIADHIAQNRLLVLRHR